MCFTLNNWTEEDLEVFKKWKYTYLVYGKEVGEECGTPHLQGYVEWSSSKEYATVHKYWNGRGHWRQRQKTPQQASEYCKKDGDFFEDGKLSEQGKRTDLEQMVEMVKERKSMKEIALFNPTCFIKYNKGLIQFKETITEHRTCAPWVGWRWGLAGRGKSYFVRQKYPDLYEKDGTKWWFGYEQQECILIDDFDGQWPFRNFLRLLDEGRFIAETKGGNVKINSPIIYITCEFPPSHFWANNELEQVTSRLDSIVEVTGPNLREAAKEK